MNTINTGSAGLNIAGSACTRSGPRLDERG